MARNFPRSDMKQNALVNTPRFPVLNKKGEASTYFHDESDEYGEEDIEQGLRVKHDPREGEASTYSPYHSHWHHDPDYDNSFDCNFCQDDIKNGNEPSPGRTWLEESHEEGEASTYRSHAQRPHAHPGGPYHCKKRHYDDEGEESTYVSGFEISSVLILTQMDDETAADRTITITFD
ncbi:hypothetical protein [Wolbachia endosymbiont of Folsomia candida]|uniref:hypothetical protein n=1 Tax=Wolbachia endosymbiont of Folsomia candida TaxID=169402 RepID=UPI000A69898F|nr:hypothetical protein [Wolbachia endosymbiont of Folsomia candida]APR98202.1 hypothetical protein ASM33_02730 [Wolbachia endosymbiont of Folsomia candida]